jgi:hypothetical protein
VPLEVDHLLDGGFLAAFGSTAVTGVARARRALRERLAADAGDALLPGTYQCTVWVGLDEIHRAAEVIRQVRPTMISNPNPFDHLEQAISEALSSSSDDDPPVLLLGCVAVSHDPAGDAPHPASGGAQSGHDASG